jgi:hypothetical protein
MRGLRVGEQATIKTKMQGSLHCAFAKNANAPVEMTNCTVDARSRAAPVEMTEDGVVIERFQDAWCFGRV